MVMVVLDFDGIEVWKYQILENCFHNIFKFVLFLFESFEMTTIKVRAVEITNPLETYFLDMMQNVKGERESTWNILPGHDAKRKGWKGSHLSAGGFTRELQQTRLPHN